MKRISLSLFLMSTLFSCQTPVNSNTPEINVVTEASAKTLAVGKTPHGMSANTDFVYNSNTGSGTISVIDSRSDSVVKTLSVEGSPGHSKISHDAKYVLTLSKKEDGSSLLYIFEPAQAHRIVRSLVVGQGADKIQISDDDQHVYLSLVGEAGVAHFHFPQGLGQMPEERKLIAAGPGSPDGKGHRSLDVKMGWALTSNPGDNSSSLISPEGKAQTLRDGNEPGPVGLGLWQGNISKAIVGNKASHTISLFTPGNDTPVTLSDVGQSPTDMVTVPALGRAYITMTGSNHVAVVDYVKGKLIGTVETQARPVHIYAVSAIAADETENKEAAKQLEIWVGNDAGDSVTVFDAESMELIKHHPTGVGHHKMAFSRNKAYISNITDGTITVIQR